MTKKNDFLWSTIAYICTIETAVSEMTVSEMTVSEMTVSEMTVSEMTVSKKFTILSAIACGKIKWPKSKQPLIGRLAVT